MALATLDATVGGASSNTFATQSECDNYDDSRPASSGNEWSGAASAVKDEALLWAAKLMESLFAWTGYRVDSTQALTWPRSGMWDRNDNAIATTVIPQELKDAQCEYARLLIASDLAADSDIEKQKIRSLKAGPVSLEFGSGVSGAEARVPDAVALLLPRDWYTSIRGRSRGFRTAVRA